MYACGLTYGQCPSLFRAILCIYVVVLNYNNNWKFIQYGCTVDSGTIGADYHHLSAFRSTAEHAAVYPVWIPPPFTFRRKKLTEGSAVIHVSKEERARATSHGTWRV